MACIEYWRCLRVWSGYRALLDNMESIHERVVNLWQKYEVSLTKYCLGASKNNMLKTHKFIWHILYICRIQLRISCRLPSFMYNHPIPLPSKKKHWCIGVKVNRSTIYTLYNKILVLKSALMEKDYFCKTSRHSESDQRAWSEVLEIHLVHSYW